MNELYETIKRKCKEHGVSVSKMCLDIGVSKSTLSSLKNGVSKSLSAQTLLKIADYLDCSVSELMGGPKVHVTYTDGPVPTYPLAENKKTATANGDGGSYTLSKRDQIILLLEKLTDQELSMLLSQIKGLLSDREARGGSQ